MNQQHAGGPERSSGDPDNCPNQTTPAATHQELAKQAAHLTPQERDLILHDNVAELYGLGAA